MNLICVKGGGFLFQYLDIMDSLLRIPGILLGFTFHEYAHAYAATKFGDPTPGRDGRLTANPLAHTDIWGLLLFIFAGFGWAKPVRTNPSYYHGDVKKKDIIVSLAGPATNLVITIISSLMYIAFIKTGAYKIAGGNTQYIIMEVIWNIILMNSVMFIFNLIPIPPLDGYHILIDLIPHVSYEFMAFVERYGFIILSVFILSPASNYIVGNGAAAVVKTILGAMQAIFTVF